jgi:hypothetical protein
MGRVAVDIWRADLRSAAEDMGEGNPTPDLVAEDRAAFNRTEAVIGIVWIFTGAGLESEGAIEVASNASGNAAGNPVPVVAIDVAVERLKIAAPEKEIDVGWPGAARAGRSSLAKGGGRKQSDTDRDDRGAEFGRAEEHDVFSSR